MVLVLNLAKKENKSKMAALVTGSTDFDKMEDGLISWPFCGLRVAVLFFSDNKGRVGEEAGKMAVLPIWSTTAIRRPEFQRHNEQLLDYSMPRPL